MHLPRMRRPSASMLVALLALFVAVGGTSVAASSLINGKSIKKNSLPGDRVKKASLSGDRLKNGAITEKQVNLAKLGTVPNATNAVTAGTATTATNATNATNADTAAALKTLKIRKPTRVTPSAEAATEAAARAAATKIELLSSGSVSVYAKCFKDTGANEVHAELYAATTQDGTIFDSRSDDLEGNNGTDFLNVATAEDLRQADTNVAGANTAAGDNDDDSDFSLYAPDGSWLRGFATIGAKNGTLPTTQGAWGDGSACIFGAWAVG